MLTLMTDKFVAERTSTPLAFDDDGAMGASAAGDRDRLASLLPRSGFHHRGPDLIGT